LRLDWQWCIAESFHDGRSEPVPIGNFRLGESGEFHTFGKNPRRLPVAFSTELSSNYERVSCLTLAGAGGPCCAVGDSGANRGCERDGRGRHAHGRGRHGQRRRVWWARNGYARSPGNVISFL